MSDVFRGLGVQAEALGDPRGLAQRLPARLLPVKSVGPRDERLGIAPRSTRAQGPSVAVSQSDSPPSLYSKAEGAENDASSGSPDPARPGAGNLGPSRSDAGAGVARPRRSGALRAGPDLRGRATRREVGWMRGIEPPTPRTTIWCSNRLSYIHQPGSLGAGPKGLDRRARAAEDPARGAPCQAPPAPRPRPRVRGAVPAFPPPRG